MEETLSSKVGKESTISRETIQSLYNILRDHFDSDDVEKSKNKIFLHEPTFGAQEAIEFLLPVMEKRVTLGKRVVKAEEKLRRTLGTEHAALCNSGSSSNLLALSCLRSQYYDDRARFADGDEVIVPAVAWSTSIWPIVQMKLTPVFVDCDLSTLNIDPSEIEKAISSKTKAILLIHVYGNPCYMAEIMRIAKKYDLIVIEDCCEALGAYYDGKHVGGFGKIATYSFYYSHHITSIEGGAVATNDKQLDTIIRMQRGHGWSRESDWHKELSEQNTRLNPKYLFADLGYNVRPTEPQAAMLDCQLDKLEMYVSHRNDVGTQLQSFFLRHSNHFIVQRQYDTAYSSYMGFPVVCKSSEFSREDILEFLHGNGIPTRPVIAGNIVRHPGCNEIQMRISGSLSNADQVLENGFVIPVHQGITQEMINHIKERFNKYLQ